MRELKPLEVNLRDAMNLDQVLLLALVGTAAAFLPASLSNRGVLTTFSPTALEGRGDKRTTKGKRFMKSNG